MKPLTISDAESMILAIQDEIRRSEESRYDHRLHAILLVAQGISCSGAAQMLGDAPRTVAYWVRRFEERGFSGLMDRERSGRRPRLGKDQMAAIGDALRRSPHEFGLSGPRDGKTLSLFIQQNWGTSLGVRQCQRLFRDLGFRFRKPRPKMAHADPERQATYKKNPLPGA
jgi:transposase